ncbi:hypothetical protein MKZ38_006294 [Zalerion maritima]|uniref:Mediator of RNA polymerase II transcription subunit 4 n=1 Tax=Zalerion maritima TaxID=339359 RepID=A0AAD5WQD5_9PEZI|nr:hypothetical protein MKZ38_006294 [Zalerion maritima]
MDKQIDARFERVEKALTTLVESITKYNPSVGAANDLVQAERHLSQGLEDVQTHQNNHLRLQQLRKATTTLDTQIKIILVSLATTRKELISTPATKYPTDQQPYQFTYSELLSYARRISKTTQPFMGASLEGMGLDKDGNPLPQNGEQSDTAGGAGQNESQPQAQGPGAGSSNAPNGTSTTNNNNQANGTHPSSSQNNSQNTSQSTLIPTPLATPLSNPNHPNAPALPPQVSLPPPLHKKANPLQNTLFYPFPSQAKILSGCLVANELLQSRGIDPKNYDPVLEAQKQEQEAASRAEQAEKERVEREEENNRIRLEREEALKKKAEEVRREKERMKEREREREEEERRRRRESMFPGAMAGAGEAQAAGSAISPTTEKISGKGEFKFADLDDEDD